MQAIISSKEEIAERYTATTQALYDIGRAYFTLGKAEDAKQVLQAGLSLLEADEVQPQNRLKLLLLYTQVLIIDQFLGNTTPELVFSTALSAKQLAETSQDQQGQADALSSLGQAHYFARIIGAINSGESVDGAQGDGKFDEAQEYQQQALALREALGDTRGASESHFLVGNVYQRWKQYDLAKEHFIKAFQIAEQHGHVYEKSEPSRHLALQAMIEGDMEQALSHALQALAFREEAGFRPYLPLDHILLSSIYLNKKNTANALLQAQQAFALAEELGFKRIIANALVTLGDAQLALKEDEEARATFEKALALAQEAQSAMYIARATQRLQSLGNK